MGVASSFSGRGLPLLRRSSMAPVSVSPLLIFLFLAIVQLSTAVSSEQQALIDEILDESLRAHRVQACDGERVTLHCPRNTHIFVGTGFYGRVVPESQLCPSRQPSTGRKDYDASCDVLQAKTRLSEVCDKKRKCQVTVGADTFDADPCPSTSKYLQMTYKCKPVSFDSETFCSGGDMNLRCRDGRRLAVFSATFGRSVRSPTPPCSTGVSPVRDCQLDVLPKVLSSCHARTECTLPVSVEAFGRPPCPVGVEPVLNILFMCVNEEIFSEEAITGDLPSLEKYKKEMDSINYETTWERLSERPDAVEKSEPVAPVKPSPAIMPQQEEQKPSNDAGYVKEEDEWRNSEAEGERHEEVKANAVGIAHDVVIVAQFFKENREKLIVCVALSTIFALTLLTIACIARRCSKTEEPKRVHYSIERSRLLAANNSPYSVLGGPCSSTDLGELDDRILRYSLTTPPRSSHYDF